MAVLHIFVVSESLLDYAPPAPFDQRGVHDPSEYVFAHARTPGAVLAGVNAQLADYGLPAMEMEAGLDPDTEAGDDCRWCGGAFLPEDAVYAPARDIDAAVNAVKRWVASGWR